MIFSPLALVIVLLPLVSLSMNDTLQNSSNFCLWLSISDTALLFERGIFIASLDVSKVIGLRNIARAQKWNGLRNPGIARKVRIPILRSVILGLRDFLVCAEHIHEGLTGFFVVSLLYRRYSLLNLRKLGPERSEPYLLTYHSVDIDNCFKSLVSPSGI